MNEWRYLGDGVYARFDGYHIVLITGTPDSSDSRIYLDDRVSMALYGFIADTLFHPDGVEKDEQDD